MISNAILVLDQATSVSILGSILKHSEGFLDVPKSNDNDSERQDGIDIGEGTVSALSE